MWDSPAEESSNDDEEDIEGYSVELFSPDLQQGWLVAADRIRVRKYTVTGLRPDTTYVFIVRARNSYGLGRTSPISKAIKTTASKAGHGYSNQQMGKAYSELNSVEVKIRNAKAINSTAVSLDWSVVGDREYIEGYYIWFREVSAVAAEDKYSMVTIWGGKRNRFILKDLNQFTRYDIFCVPFFKTLKGSPSNIKSVTTFEDGT